MSSYPSKNNNSTRLCPYCGQAQSLSNIFCESCGKRLVQEQPAPKNVCRYCESVLPEGAVRCPACGKKVARSSSDRSTGKLLPWIIAGVAVLLALVVLIIAKPWDVHDHSSALPPVSTSTPSKSPAADPPAVKVPAAQTVTGIDLFCGSQIVREFTMTVGDAPFPLSVQTYPDPLSSVYRVMWSIDDQSVATLSLTDSGCEIHAVGAGTAKLTASYDDVETVCTIHVISAGPGPDDMWGCNEKVVVPNDENWLPDYETRYIKASRGICIYLRYGPGQDYDWFDRVYQKEAVTVLAKQNGYYLIITQTGQVGWGTASMIVDKY